LPTRGLSADTLFPHLLKGISNAFVEWRYWYERNTVSEGVPIAEVIAAGLILHRVAQQKIWPGSRFVEA
jgi:hypothetical protein